MTEVKVDVLAQRHPVVVIIGPTLVGKSTIARRLARHLGRLYVDSDHVITTEHGPICTIFANHGEAHFRDLEALVVQKVLASQEPVVIALGGGAPLHPQTAQLLAATTVVYLDAHERTIAKRLSSAKSRPLLVPPATEGSSEGEQASETLLARWRHLHAQRRKHYRALADLTVSVDGSNIAAIVGRIIRSLESAPAPGSSYWSVSG